MKKSIVTFCFIFLFAWQAVAQNNDACAAMKTVINALTSKDYGKVVDWKDKRGMFYYGSKVSIPGFSNCRFMVTGGVALFEAEYDDSNIPDNRKMLSDLQWLIAPCFSGFASSIQENKHVWFKDGNPAAGSITIYDRGNGQYLEIAISGGSGN